MDSLFLWPTPLHSQVMSPTSASTSAVSTRRSISHPGKTASTLESDLTNTVAVSEDFDHLPQQLAANGSRHSVASNVPAMLNLGSLSGIGKVRGTDSVAGLLSSARKQLRRNDSVASVEESVLKGKRGRDFTQCANLVGQAKSP